MFNDRGFVENDNKDSIIFSKRNVYTFVNVFSTSYVLNNRAGLTLRVRHYWSGDRNKQFYVLQQDGSLKDNYLYHQNKDINFNAFTVDMIFRWIFSPGSELTLAWKSSADTEQNRVIGNYWNNLQKSWQNQANSFSLRILYYIDYNNLKRKQPVK
jgi:hypothetical protein